LLILEQEKKDWLLEQASVSDPNWTEIARQYEENFGERRHRSTIRRWVLSLLREVQIMELHGEDGLLQDEVATTRAKLERSHFKKRVTALVNKQLSHENIVDVIQKTTQALPPVEVKTYSKPKTKSDSPIVAVAPLTDLHIGEGIDSDQMGGMNEYNFEIFSRRLYGWTNQVLDLVSLRREHSSIPILKVPMLGDMVSGEIHEELVRSNLDNIVMTMARGAYMTAQSMIVLAQHFEEVQIDAVVGNHQRLRKEIYYKDKYVGWDFLFYQWVAAFCKNQKNIKFTIPKTFYQLIDVAGWDVLIHHGDAMRGSSMQQKVHSLRQALQPQGKSFQYMLMGHYHHVEEHDIGTGTALMCGCMKGTDEYAFLNGLASKASHVLTFFHPKHGMISRDTIFLERYDTAQHSFNDYVPEIWSSLIE
jgi:hypothetical protein|tara:strand:+ start:1039 stop:2292 length:1254 start_codon:yes stop_codon:yes gene_type:complete